MERFSLLNLLMNTEALSSAEYARRLVGRLAIFYSLGAIDTQSQSEHVDTDWVGCRRCIRLQRRRHIRSRLVPSTFAVHGGRIGTYYEAAAVIASLTLLGQILELRARSQTSAAIKSLMGLAPKTARRIREDGTEEDVPLTHVHLGDVLRVRPGEKVPVVRGRRRRAPPFPPVNQKSSHPGAFFVLPPATHPFTHVDVGFQYYVIGPE